MATSNDKKEKVYTQPVIETTDTSDATGTSGTTDTTQTFSSEYNAPSYSDSYRDGIDTSYYTNAIAKYTDTQNKNRQSQIADANKTKVNALREAYISKLQNQKALNQNLAQAGIRGGATETSNLKLANIYGQARNSANSDYSTSVSNTNKSIDENILNYDMDMTSRAEEYVQNMALAKWQAAREDYANAIAQQNWAAEMQYQQSQDASDLTDKINEQTYNSNVTSTTYNTKYAIYSAYKDSTSNVKRLQSKIDTYSECLANGVTTSGTALTAEKKAEYEGIIQAASQAKSEMKEALAAKKS